jgi:hypothetical protein
MSVGFSFRFGFYVTWSEILICFADLAAVQFTDIFVRLDTGVHRWRG